MVLEVLEQSSNEGLSRLQEMARRSEAGEKGGDVFSSRELERLVSMQQRVTRNYFRLLEAHGELRRRVGTARSTGTVLADALDSERQRLGRELHTGVGQALAGIQLHAGLLEAALPDPPERARKSLARIRELAGVAMDQVRGVSRGLYVPAWQAQPLTEALRDLWQRSGVAEKYAGSLELQAPSCEPAPEVRRALYLAAQEGISNAILHANARHVRMSLREEGGRIALEVEDDGTGFGAPAPAASASAGIGLRSLRDLARELGGGLEVRGTAQGTILSISFPVTHE